MVFPPGQCISPQLHPDYLTKVGIKTVPQPPYSSELAPSDFWLFPKLRGCRYETIEEIVSIKVPIQKKSLETYLMILGPILMPTSLFVDEILLSRYVK